MPSKKQAHPCPCRKRLRSLRKKEMTPVKTSPTSNLPSFTQSIRNYVKSKCDKYNLPKCLLFTANYRLLVFV